MNLEQQVVSLEYAKRLKELGVEQQSLFYWFPHRSIETHELIEWVIIQNKGGSDESCSAFTVAELGEMFDRELKIHSGKTVSYLELYYCAYIESSSEGYWNKTHCFNADTEANARAKMLVHLIENKLYDQKTQKTSANSHGVNT